MLLKLDHQKIDDMLNNGHDWANDHISKAKENIVQVFEFFNDGKPVSEASTATLSRQYSMNSTWWSAWRLENEKKDKKFTNNHWASIGFNDFDLCANVHIAP